MADDADQRAKAITAGWHGIQLKYEWAGAPSLTPAAPSFNVVGEGAVQAVTDAIAAAIREAVAAERERCAEVAEDLYPKIDGPGWLQQEVNRGIAREVAREILKVPT